MILVWLDAKRSTISRNTWGGEGIFMKVPGPVHSYSINIKYYAKCTLSLEKHLATRLSITIFFRVFVHPDVICILFAGRF